MLVAVAGDFRALPLLLVRYLEQLHEECGSAAAEREAAALDASASGRAYAAPSTRSPLARDALDVLAPLADRFGLNQLKNVRGRVQETPRNVRRFRTLEASISVGFQA